MNKETQWLLKEKYGGEASKKFYKDVERLTAGEPVDYVIGFTEFLGCKIDLSKKPLTPRPETEFWVERELQQIKKGKVLDIFSGSGCIGIAVLKRGLLCDISDIDLKAIQQIRKNLKINNVTGKVIASNIFSNIKGVYNYIFANPPYIPTARSDKIQKSVLKYEPKKALFGGGDGLFYIKKFLKEAKSRLNPGGSIFMEFDPPQKRAIESLLKKYGYASWQFNKDQYHRWRWVSISA